MTTINKSLITKAKADEVSTEDMELINLLAIKALSADEVFVFSVVLCDNEIDRDYERFTVGTLKSLKDLFVGKTAILNHSMRTEDQSARTFKTEVITDSKRKNSLGEPYVYLKAWAYMLKNEKNTDLISEIQAGIKKETSVSCSVNECLCSICGKNLKKSFCKHKKGEMIDGKLCYTELVTATDAYEWSFVAVPAQKNAGVVKSFKQNEKAGGERKVNDIIKSLNCEEEVTLSKSEASRLQSYIEELKSLATDGENYRNELEKEVVKLSAISVSNIRSEQMEKICKHLSTEELRILKSGLSEKADELLPPISQLSVKEKVNLSTKINNDFKI